MAVDNSFMVRKVQEKENMIVAYCAYTAKPLLVCDPETFDDEVWIFDTQEQLNEFAKPFMEKKVVVRGIRYENKDFLHFFSTLYTIGVNRLVFVDAEGTVTKMDLADLVKEPDYTKLEPSRRPILNPNLQLTGIYFMQEASRPVPNEQKEGLKDLEEELAANMVKATYILSLELEDGPEDDMTKFREKKYKIPILKDKNDQVFQPIFTDPIEFERFAKGKKLNAISVPFRSLAKVLTAEAKGFMLNPNGYHILMPKELLGGLAKRFGTEA